MLIVELEIAGQDEAVEVFIGGYTHTLTHTHTNTHTHNNAWYVVVLVLNW